MPPLPSLPDLPPSVPPSSDLDRLAQKISDRVARRSDVIPVTYGRDRVEGRLCVFYVDETNGFYYMAFAFCLGEIQEFEKVLIDNVDINEPTTGFLAKYAGSGGAVNLYVGNQTQNADPLLAAVISGYADNLRGKAYCVIKFPSASLSGMPSVDAIVKGLKLYDPRLDSTQPGGSGAHRLNDTTTWAYSDTPALAHAHFLYTAGWNVDWTTVPALANANEEMIGSPAEKRRIIGLTLTQPEDIPSWNSVFRAHSGSITYWEDGLLKFVADKKDVDFIGAINIVALDSGGTGPSVTLGAEWTIEAKLDPSSLNPNSNTGAIFFNIVDYLYGRIEDTTGRALVAWKDSGEVERSLTSPSGQDFFVGEFHHFAATHKNNTTKLYVDGVLMATDSVNDSKSISGVMHIGKYNSADWGFLGKIDEVRVWTKERTITEIQDNMDVELAGNETGLFAYYRCNEMNGQTLNDSGPNNYDATLTATVQWAEGDLDLTPYGVAHVFTDDDIFEGTMTLTKRGVREAPTVMVVEYTDHTGNTWYPDSQKAERVGVEDGSVPRRESRVALNGVHRASQALREATERLNKLINDLSGQFEAFDIGAKVVPGSIIQITHSLGLNKKLARVLRCDDDKGRYQISFDEYDPAAYSDSVIAAPTYADTNLGNPLNPPLVSNLTLVEELYYQKNGDVSSRLRVAWDAVKYPYFSQVVVEGYIGSTLMFSGTTTSNAMLITGVDELVSLAPVEYSVKVYVESPYRRGSPAQSTVTVNGKFLPPGNVPSVSCAQNGASTAKATWGKAVDIDIWRYEVRLGTPGQTWEQGTFKQLVDGLDYELSGLALGSYRVMVKALDSVRNYSTDMTFADFTISRPANVATLSGYEVAGEVRLNWTEVTGFVAFYKVSYRPSGGGSPVVLIDKVNSLRLITKDVPEGTWRFEVVAVDDAGNESATAAFIEFAVTSDADAFLADSHDFITPSVTNMHSWQAEDGDVLKTYYVTATSTSFGNTSFQDFSADELANYHSSTSSEWLSETVDFGAQLTGTFLAEYPGVTVPNGTVTKTLELSTNNSTWDTFTTSSAKGTYRYARIRLSTTTTSTMQVVTPNGVLVKVNVVPLEESGESTSLTSGIKTITLSRPYTFTKEISVTPIGSGVMTTAVDTIVMGDPSSFGVYVFDKYGQKIATTFRWQFKGV